MEPMTLDTFPFKVIKQMREHTEQRLCDAAEALSVAEELVRRECDNIDPDTNPEDFVAIYPYEADALCTAQIEFDDALAVRGEWKV